MNSIKTDNTCWTTTNQILAPYSGDIGTNHQYINEIARLHQELARIKAEAKKGLTDGKFDGTDDSNLILELIARGYAVYKPVA